MAEQGEEKGADAGKQRNQQRTGQKPGEQADQRAAHQRAEWSSQQGAQCAAGHQHDDEKQRQQVRNFQTVAGRALGRGRQGFAIDQPDDLLDAGGDAAVKITLAQARRDQLADDPFAEGIVQHPFEPIAHLDAQGPVILGDDQQHAVVDLLPSQLPLLHHPHRVLLDRLGLGGGDQQQRDLAPLALFESTQPLLDGALLFRGQGGGLVDDRCGQGRYRQLGMADPDDAEQCCQQQPGHAFWQAEPVHRDLLSGAGAKSTLGAVEICCSFSTLKLGFTW